MKIRGIRPEDITVLKEIHEKMGFGYPFPELQIQDVGRVLVDENDRPVQALLGVPVMEMYFLMDPEWLSPVDRFDAFKELHKEMHREVACRGYAFAQADIPPEVEKSFGRRLKRLGWVKNIWSTFSFKI